MRLLLVACVVAVLAGVAVSLAMGASGSSGGPSEGVIAYEGIRGSTGTLYRIAASGGVRQSIVSGVDNWWGFSWSPDGSRIAFTKAAGGIHVVSVDGTDVRPVFGSSRDGGRFGDAGDSSWSPDGSRLAFAARGPGAADIYTVKLDGTGLRRLTFQYRNYYPDWSPDGQWIMYERHVRAGLSELMAIHPDGSGLHRIAEVVTGKQCLCADWSPDGSRIAYQGTLDRDSSRPEIFVMNADGTGRTRLTVNNVRDENPDWAPDSTRIAFYSERLGNGEIFFINGDGTRLRRVTHDSWYSAFPRWQPTK
jgi:Tol biopolymer transport system component